MPQKTFHVLRWNTDQKIGAGLLGLCVLLYFLIIPREIDSSGSGLVGLNPAFMPQLLTILLAGFSALLIIFGRPAEKNPEGIRPFPKPVWLTLAFLVFYAYALEPLGYLPTTTLTLAGFLYFFGTRKITVIAAMSISIPLILYWFFGKVMLVMLPVGTLFS